MQRDISNSMQLAQSLNPLKDSIRVESTDYSVDFKNMLTKWYEGV